MADTKTPAADQSGPTGKPTTPPAAPAVRPTGIAPAPSAGVKIGSEPYPLSKGQRKHRRRQKEAGKIKVTDRRSQVSR